MSFDTERFIVEIENRPSLWNSACSEYSDRNIKIKSWEELVEIFKDKNRMTVYEKKELGDTLQKKWKSIRGCYTRELQRQKSLKSGPRKSEYLFFQQLQFLKDVVATREPDIVPIAEGMEEVTRQQEREVTKCPKRLKKRDSSTCEDNKFIETLNRSIERQQKYEANYEEDEDKLFLLSLVNTLKRVPSHKKIAIKIKIMSVLDEATTNVS